MFHVRTVLVGIDLRIGIVAVGTQTLPVALAANADVCPLCLLEREACIITGRVCHERGVPRINL